MFFFYSVSMQELKKYIIRFGFAIAGAFFFAGLLGAEQIKIVAYKIGMVITGVTVAELTWIFFFKPVFGVTEEIVGNERFKAVLLFRGILYAGIIIALTLGL